MYISHKSNVIQQVSNVEWNCRRMTKGLSKADYWAWQESVTTSTGSRDTGDFEETVDYSGETGYVIVECTDEDVIARLAQLDEYIDSTRDIVYNIKYYASKRDSEIVDVEAHTIAAHTDEDGNDVAEEDVATTYVQSHFIGDDSAKDARLLAEKWTRIRRERSELLAETDWMASKDLTLSAAWKTYRQELRDVPTQSDPDNIIWPTKPS